MTKELQHRLVRIAIVAVIFLLFGVMFLPFFTPLLMAALFAFALDRVVQKYGIKKSSRRVPALLILGGIVLFVTLPLALIGYRLALLAGEVARFRDGNSTVFASLESFIQRVSAFVDKTMVMFDGKAPEFNHMDFLTAAGSWLLAQTAPLASRAPELVLDLFVFSAALYVLLTEAKFIRRSISRFQILKEEELSQIITVVQKTSYITLVVSAVVGGVQALIVALGGVIFGFPEFLLLFVLTFFCSLIPVIGAAPIGLLLGVLALAQGNTGSAIGLLVVSLVAGSVDNVLKPYLVSSASEESLNPVISLLAIIGAVLVYGLPGLLLGPILTELAMKIIPILFYEEEVESAAADSAKGTGELARAGGDAPPVGKGPL